VDGKAELEDAREAEAEVARDRRDEGTAGADVLLGERETEGLLHRHDVGQLLIAWWPRGMSSLMHNSCPA